MEQLHVFMFIFYICCSLMKDTTQILPETSYQKTGCYGALPLEYGFITASCPTDEVIAVEGVSSGTKLTSSGCEREANANGFNETDYSTCCFPAVDDCIFGYSSTSKSVIYNEACTGKTECSTLPVATMLTPSAQCDTTATYWETSTYLFIDYYCIADSKIGECSSANLQNDGRGSVLYIWNTGYPDMEMTSDTSCTCSVEADCFTTVNVTAIDVRFENQSEICYHSISFGDVYGTTTFDCDLSNSFDVRHIFTSESNFLTMNISNTFSSQAGYFWLAFQSSNGGNLKINCPQSEHTQNCSTPTTETSPAITLTSITETTDADTISTTAGITSVTTDRRVTTMQTTTENVNSLDTTTFTTENTDTLTETTTENRDILASTTVISWYITTETSTTSSDITDTTLETTSTDSDNLGATTETSAVTSNNSNVSAVMLSSSKMGFVNTTDTTVSSFSNMNTTNETTPATTFQNESASREVTSITLSTTANTIKTNETKSTLAEDTTSVDVAEFEGTTMTNSDISFTSQPGSESQSQSKSATSGFPWWIAVIVVLLVVIFAVVTTMIWKIKKGKFSPSGEKKRLNDEEDAKSVAVTNSDSNKEKHTQAELSVGNENDFYSVDDAMDTLNAAIPVIFLHQKPPEQSQLNLISSNIFDSMPNDLNSKSVLPPTRLQPIQNLNTVNEKENVQKKKKKKKKKHHKKQEGDLNTETSEEIKANEIGQHDCFLDPTSSVNTKGNGRCLSDTSPINFHYDQTKTTEKSSDIIFKEQDQLQMHSRGDVNEYSIGSANLYKEVCYDTTGTDAGNKAIKRSKEKKKLKKRKKNTSEDKDNIQTDFDHISDRSLRAVPTHDPFLYIKDELPRSVLVTKLGLPRDLTEIDC